MDSSLATLAMSTPTMVLSYAAAFFFVVVAIAAAYALFKAGGTLQRVDTVLGDVDREAVPLLQKAGTTLDGVNANLGNVDRDHQGRRRHHRQDRQDGHRRRGRRQHPGAQGGLVQRRASRARVTSFMRATRRRRPAALRRRRRRPGRDAWSTPSSAPASDAAAAADAVAGMPPTPPPRPRTRRRPPRHAAAAETPWPTPRRGDRREGLTWGCPTKLIVAAPSPARRSPIRAHPPPADRRGLPVTSCGSCRPTPCAGPATRAQGRSWPSRRARRPRVTATRSSPGS